MTAAIDEILRNPAWLAHRYDAPNDAFQFVMADRAARDRAPFLTDADLRPDPPQAIRRDDALAAAPAAAPVHFVFHSAYCCSTLLARAFDLPGMSTALKEPQLLNDVVGWRHRGADPRLVGPVLDAGLRLLQRPFETGEHVVIKPSNVISALMEPILLLRPSARAILLYAPLPAYVASIARKGLDGRLWVRDLLSKQLVDGTVNLGFTPKDYLLLTDLQVAAVGWLAQHVLFMRIAATMPERCRMLNSEELVAHPSAALAAVAAFFGLPIGEEKAAFIAAHEFGRDAKSGASFAPGERKAQQEAGEELHRDEITKVLAWAGQVANAAGTTVDAPVPLHLTTA
jgi:hypothetical protein